MTRFARSVLVLGASGLALQPVTHAHFKLVEPAPWIVEDDRGDPQKSGPCGGTNTDWGTASGVVTSAVGGGTLHLKMHETIFHPGHYRVALAVNSPTELPLDPETKTRPSDRGPWSVSAMVEMPAQIPVLADGLFPHYTPPTRGRSLPEPWETDIQLPNINCEKCTLQVIQWMAEHAYMNPGAFSYHHCAHIQITADPSKPLDEGWPTEQ
jgi:hypothetical protein